MEERERLLLQCFSLSLKNLTTRLRHVLFRRLHQSAFRESLRPIGSSRAVDNTRIAKGN